MPETPASALGAAIIHPGAIPDAHARDIAPGAYKASTLSAALKQLVDAGALQKEGDRKGAKYRLSAALLKRLFTGID